jgi:hypothetical protein
MAASGDLLIGQLATVQSEVSPKPNSIVTAATIAPTTFLTLLTGTTQIKTITPPVAGAHMLAFMFATTSNTQAVFLTTGNIEVTATTVALLIPFLMVYRPDTAKYYPLLSR